MKTLRLAYKPFVHLIQDSTPAICTINGFPTIMHVPYKDHYLGTNRVTKKRTREKQNRKWEDTVINQQVITFIQAKTNHENREM